jgi:hypothetical protein
MVTVSRTTQIALVGVKMIQPLTSFRADIVPLFRDRDLNCMRRHGVQLDDFAYMSSAVGDASFADHANARHVLARLNGSEAPPMPPDSPWPEPQITLFSDLIEEGCLP